MRPIGKLGKMLLTFVFVFGFLGIVNANANDSPFIEEGTISYNVCPGAKITKVSYYFKKFKGKQTICFEVNLKNVSNENKRFKMTVDIQEGPVASYFYPRKGKPPLLKPGEEYCKPMPMVFFNKLPASFSIIVSEM